MAKRINSSELSEKARIFAYIKNSEMRKIRGSKTIKEAIEHEVYNYGSKKIASVFDITERIPKEANTKYTFATNSKKYSDSCKKFAEWLITKI